MSGVLISWLAWEIFDHTHFWQHTWHSLLTYMFSQLSLNNPISYFSYKIKTSALPVFLCLVVFHFFLAAAIFMLRASAKI
jgi:hypothetical protein